VYHSIIDKIVGKKIKIKKLVIVTTVNRWKRDEIEQGKAFVFWRYNIMVHGH